MSASFINISALAITVDLHLTKDLSCVQKASNPVWKLAFSVDLVDWALFHL